MLSHLFRAKRRVARPARLEVEALEARWVPSSAYLATDLVSDQPGVAAITDPHLVNAWGIALNPNAGAFWVASNAKDLSLLYRGDVNGSAFQKVSLEVATHVGSPTGEVFNGTTDFQIGPSSSSVPATFIFASESGAVSAWNTNIPSSPSTDAVVQFQASDGAIYKGIALANNGSGNFLYLADFHNNKIDVLNGSFQLTTLSGSFTDTHLPQGYAPFNVAAINGKLYVTYAQQDSTAEDDVAGKGHGFIDVFDLNGNFQKRLVTRGVLNSPWGMVIAPASFGTFSNDLLVGNFGNGQINAFDPTTGAFKGRLTESPGHPVVIDGLWGLTFGNGVSAGDGTTLYFAAGPAGESHGLFGKITANPAGTNPVSAQLTSGNLIITGSPDNDKVTVRLDSTGDLVVVKSNGKVIGQFDLASLDTIQFNGLAGNDTINVDSHITVTTILNGGAGNNVLTGGGGNNILIGGIGNDRLNSRGGRDILIGGGGRDQLNGNDNDDILISGSTNYDNDTTSLLNILTEWTSTDSYLTRVDKLRHGTGGLPVLDGTTVLDDAIRDVLDGGSSLDWFFAGATDQIKHKGATEQTN